MTALEEIKKALEELREDMGVAYDKGDSRISNILVWCDALKAISPTLESLQRENEELRKHKDHIAAEKTGIATNSHNNVDYWKSQAEAAEAEVKRLETELALSKPLYSRRQIEARVKALEAALKPFAEYMGDHFDKDNHGNPLPDDLGVGWIYLTHADFRRARTALASTGGEHNAE